MSGRKNKNLANCEKHGIIECGSWKRPAFGGCVGAWDSSCQAGDWGALLVIGFTPFGVAAVRL